EVGWLCDSTTVKVTSSWLPLISAQAEAEARAGLRDLAWKHGLEAEAASRERLRYEIEALPDRHALQLAGRFGEPCDLLVSLMRSGEEDDLVTAWDRLVRWRGLVRQEIGGRRLPTNAAADSLAVRAH